MGNILINYCISRKESLIEEKRILYIKYVEEEDKFSNNGVINDIIVKDINKDIDNVYRI